MKTNMVRDNHRNLMAAVLALDPEARKTYSILKRMQVTDLHFDYMLVRNTRGSYDQLDDPGAWIGKLSLRPDIGVRATRFPDGSWYVQEF